jgi:hypothetical protein
MIPPSFCRPTSRLSVTAGTSSAGAIDGTATVTLTSDGAGTSGLGTSTLTPATVNVGGFVYSGQGVWTGTGGGTWGTTETTTPANWAANGGIPGITPGFLTTDSALFGTSIGKNTATVSLNGATPYLNTITFNTAGSYTSCRRQQRHDPPRQREHRDDHRHGGQQRHQRAD